MAHFKHIFIITLIILTTRCDILSPDKDKQGIEITPLHIRTQAALLKINIDQGYQGSRLIIKRDSSVIISDTIYQKDTTILDTDLKSSQNYLYSAEITNNNKPNLYSNSLNITTMDTTQHPIIEWEIDTLGIPGLSSIRDIKIVSPDNIWAVGQIIRSDPDSSWNKSGKETFNAAHWNGEKWEVMRIINSAKLYSIWYFSENDIWVTSFGFPIHWDGDKWQLYHLQNMGIDVSAGFGIWASSPDNIYFVGYEGSIVHYDGSNFEKMESGTTTNLYGIWGIDEEHIWACGMDINSPNSAILSLEEEGWEIIGKPEQYRKGCSFRSIWTDNPYILYLNGYSGRAYYETIQDSVIFFNNDGDWVGEPIDGLAINNIFATTTGSEVLHYNGSSWHLYSEIKNKFGHSFKIQSLDVTDDMIVAGGYYFLAYNSIPIIIRGYY